MNRYPLPLLLAVCVSTVQAKAVAFIPNKANTRIIFTDQPCKTGAQAYVTDKSGDTYTGCWRTRNGDVKNVYVKWIDVPYEVTYSISLLQALEGA